MGDGSSTGFNAYLDRPGAEPFTDSVGYRQGKLWLSTGDLATMTSEPPHVFASWADNDPVPGRRPHLVSAVLFLAEDAPRHNGGI